LFPASRRVPVACSFGVAAGDRHLAGRFADGLEPLGPAVLFNRIDAADLPFGLAAKGYFDELVEVVDPLTPF
jgi:hypothetical protein